MWDFVLQFLRFLGECCVFCGLCRFYVSVVSGRVLFFCPKFSGVMLVLVEFAGSDAGSLVVVMLEVC